MVFVLIFCCVNVRAQSVADSIIRSATPFGWRFNFSCEPRFGQSFTYTWTGGVPSLLPPPGNVSSSGDTAIVFLDSSGGSFPYYLRLLVDTLHHTVSVGHSETMNGVGGFGIFNVPYRDSDSKIAAGVMTTNAHWTPETEAVCFCTYGWVSFNGVQPPASVSEKGFAPIAFRAIAAPDNSVRFSFETRSEASTLRIFDLLGRERDAIQIATGSESLEYDASRLTPGMYLATLGGSAVKFVVR